MIIFKKKKSFDYSQVEAMASHSSKQRTKSYKCRERQVLNTKQVEYMSGLKGEEFEESSVD